MRASPGTEPGCVFCDLAGHPDADHLVVADDRCVAFLDHRPAAVGHTLVVPRRHVTDLFEAGPDLAADLMRTAQRTAVLLRERLEPDGLTVRQNNGPASGQVVPHLHLHLVPRWHGDGTIGWPRPPEEVPDAATVLARLRT